MHAVNGKQWLEVVEQIPSRHSSEHVARLFPERSSTFKPVKPVKASGMNPVNSFWLKRRRVSSLSSGKAPKPEEEIHYPNFRNLSLTLRSRDRVSEITNTTESRKLGPYAAAQSLR